MRNIQETLQLFATDDIMDYCPEFDSVKSILEYFDRHVKPLKTLHFRSGNDAVIGDLVDRFQQMLLECEFICPVTKKPLLARNTELRKIMMFLVMNTDATYKYNVAEDPMFSHVLEICPLLPKFLLVTLAWELKLDEFFYEMLSYTPCWFSFQYFEPAAYSMKYIEDAFEVLQKSEQLARAVLISIARSQLRDIEAVDRKIIFNKLYDYTLNLLRQFYTPDADKFKSFTKRKRTRYTGYTLLHLQRIVLFAFDAYESPHKTTQPNIDIGVYEICQNVCKCLPPSERKEDVRELQEQLLRIITVLLNSLQDNTMLVTVIMFMDWVDERFDELSTLQQAVGELAYKICQRIEANSHFSHNLTSQLNVIALPPRSLADIASESSIATIAQWLVKDSLNVETKSVWFNELFNRPMTVFGNDECHELIRDNISLVTVDHCKKMIDHIKLECESRPLAIFKKEDVSESEDSDNCAGDDGDADDTLKRLLLDVSQHLDAAQVLQLLNHLVLSCGVDVSICCLSPASFPSRCIEFFNRCIDSYELKPFLILCLENPADVWARAFDTACDNKARVISFCQTVQVSAPFSTPYFERLLKAAMSSETLVERKYFPELLCEAYFTLYCPDNQITFCRTIIDEHVTALLEQQQFGRILPVAKALNLIAARGETQSHKPVNFGALTAPMLTLAARIIDEARWDLGTYTDERQELVRECIQFIRNTTKKYLPTAKMLDRKYMTKFANESCRPMTQYYFQKFDLTPDQCTVDFDKFLQPHPAPSKSETELWLIKTFVRCTVKEAEWLGRNPDLLPQFSELMPTLARLVVETPSENALLCYRNCLSNYAAIVRKYLLPKAQQQQEDVENLTLKVLKVIECVPDEMYAEAFMNFQPLMISILKHCSKSFEAVQKRAEAMQKCAAQEIFLERIKELQSN